MEVKAEHRYAKISAFKVREVTREIQGLPAEQALEIVRLIPKKAARLIGKTLASAIANAEHNNNLRAGGLVIKEAVAGEGPTLKRMHTRAREFFSVTTQSCNEVLCLRRKWLAPEGGYFQGWKSFKR